ncbi:hypothetical protein MCUN1_002547 [Malassezia cuniculi]|uniref:Uncharacterized protein n=1 Tax=Malassezia cuniculi TaxID=948313 RepID=A0AAF0JBV7_9BASI|nr:hypothetical protein MCUN1_002547 [Malassezia cuniculi]
MPAATEKDPLAALDDLDDPIDDVEQEKVIAELQRRNAKSHYSYRVLLIVLHAVVLVLYLSPFPAYIAGTHSRTHHTLFMQSSYSVGTENDLTYIPAFPIYCLLFAYYFGIIFLSVRETLFAMDIIKPTPMAFPAQPHQFGTAPNFLVPFLRDMRINKSTGNRADVPTSQPLSAYVAPRVLYLGFLWILTWPIPLLTFGSGAFEDSLWWSFMFFVMSIHVFAEHTIHKTERETVGLNGLKYAFKSA